MAEQIHLSRWAGAGWIIVFIMVSLAMLAGGFTAGYFLQGDERTIESNASAPVTVTAEVEERIAEMAPVSVKIGDASTFELTASLPADAHNPVITDSPYAVGETVREGSLLIAISNEPRFALHPTTPFFRDLSLGMSGPDVQSLNEALARAGFIETSPGDTYNWITRIGVVAMYEKAGYTAPGANPGDLLPSAVVVRLPDMNMTVVATAAQNSISMAEDVIFAATSPITAVAARLDAVQVESAEVGAPASIQIAGRGDALAGTITSVSEFRNATKDEGSFPGYDVTVTLAEPLADGAGLVGAMSIEKDAVPAPAVPVTAIRDEGSQTYVWLENAKEFEKVPVTISAEADGWAYLTAGEDIQVGDSVRVTP